MAVLRVNVDRKRPWEAPLSPIVVSARRPPVDVRRKRCRQLRKKIQRHLLGEGG